MGNMSQHGRSSGRAQSRSVKFYKASASLCQFIHRGQIWTWRAASIRVNNSWRCRLPLRQDPVTPRRGISANLLVGCERFNVQHVTLRRPSRAAAPQPWAAFTRVAHSFKGALGSIGATPAAGLAEIAPALTQLEQELARVAAVFDEPGWWEEALRREPA
jgi:hypothetical protein